MAQPSIFVMKYVDTLEVTAGEVYHGIDITSGNVMQMKTKGVNVILNSSGTAFPVTFDDLNYIDQGVTYTFSKNCIVAIGSMVEVV